SLSSVLSSAGSRSISPSFSFMSPLLSPLLSSSIGVSSSTGALLSLFVVPHADTSVNAKMDAPIFNNHLLFAMFVFPPLLFAIALSLSIFKQVILLFVFFPLSIKKPAIHDVQRVSGFTLSQMLFLLHKLLLRLQ